MRAETWEVCTFGHYVFVGRVVYVEQEGGGLDELQLRSLSGPQTGSSGSMWGENYFGSSFHLCVFFIILLPPQKKPESQHYFFTRQLPGLARAAYWTHPPPVTVDMSFCVPFNKLITISHVSPTLLPFFTHITVIIIILYLREHLSLFCAIWIIAFHTRLI